jgi:ferric-dicitrate binding protein FerR (iron transport regulator)
MNTNEPSIKLTETERYLIHSLVGSDSVSRRIAQRARIILWADAGVSVEASAKGLGYHPDTVAAWRERFLERRTEGLPTCLADLPRYRRSWS